MFIYYIRRPPDLLEATKMVKMAAWARTGIWCHTVNMNFIYIYIGYGHFTDPSLIRLRRGSVCVCVPRYMSVINLHWSKIHGHISEIGVFP